MQGPRHQLGFINRGDQSGGLVTMLLIMLALNFASGGLNNLPPTDQIIAILGSFVIATTVHEFMHAYAAWRLGDDTARSLGRITFNPVAHFDPFGFFGMVLIALGQNFIGWGKPVPVNPNRLRGRGIVGKKRSMGIVAIAGPASNVVMAAFAAVVIRLADRGTIDLGSNAQYVAWFFYVNVLLASFNMIPLPPLDGHKILTAILPAFWYPLLAPLERYGFLIIFGLFFLGGFLGTASITNEMIDPVRDLLLRVLL